MLVRCVLLYVYTMNLQYELNMMPLRWEGMRRCIEFWVTVLRLNEDRLLKVVMLEALERGSKIKWVQNLKQSLEVFGWEAICVEDLRGFRGRGWHSVF